MGDKQRPLTLSLNKYYRDAALMKEEPDIEL